MRTKTKGGLAAIFVGLAISLAFGWLIADVRSVRDEVAAIRSQQRAMDDQQRGLARRGEALRSELARGQLETAELKNRLAEREQRLTSLEASARTAQRATAPVVASMVLQATVRGDEEATLALPASADFAELRVDLDGDDGYRSFRATLLTAEGAFLWTASDLPVSASEWGQEVIVRLAATLLGEGEFELALEGLAPGGETYTLSRHRFTVIRAQ